MRERGVSGRELPLLSGLCVTVPGTAMAWEDTLMSFGRLPLAQVHLAGFAEFSACSSHSSCPWLTHCLLPQWPGRMRSGALDASHWPRYTLQGLQGLQHA